jgi:hypothetical protein
MRTLATMAAINKNRIEDQKWRDVLIPIVIAIVAFIIIGFIESIICDGIIDFVEWTCSFNQAIEIF